MEPRIEYTRTEDGVSIAYTVLGQGPPVVMSGAGFGEIDIYVRGGNPLVDALLSAKRSVVLFDGRGSGSSDRQSRDLSLEMRVRDLEAVASGLGVASFDLVGRVHGGPSAVAYAVRHPASVNHLALWDSYVRGSDYYSSSPYTRAIKALLGSAEADWEFFAMTLAHWAVGFKNAEVAQALAGAFRDGMSPDLYVTLIAATEAIDISNLLREVSVATLVVQDRTSALSVPAAGKDLASSIPGAQFVTVSGPDAGVQAIVDFMAGRAADSDGRTPEAPAFRTVLFTDLVGHTEMMSRLGDERGREVLRDHERITREVLAAHGGTEVKTMGDGFMASFASVTKAVECAIALQRAFAEREGEPLSIRVGLNAGEPIEEDGDLFGATVILASRIAAKADGGEILVADTVRGLCSGKGFLFADRGDFVAKGFEEPVRVYEVRWRE
jgi:class 3 adenylate cyclase/pimeloyl-ACP methyl ester carboxylesterase